MMKGFISEGVPLICNFLLYMTQSSVCNFSKSDYRQLFFFDSRECPITAPNHAKWWIRSYDWFRIYNPKRRLPIMSLDLCKYKYIYNVSHSLWNMATIISFLILYQIKTQAKEESINSDTVELKGITKTLTVQNERPVSWSMYFFQDG